MTDTEVRRVWSRSRATLPEPAIDTTACSASPIALMPPEPAIEKLARRARNCPISMSPEPAISAPKLGALTRSTRMSPDPAMVAPLSAGTVT